MQEVDLGVFVDGRSLQVICIGNQDKQQWCPVEAGGKQSANGVTKENVSGIDKARSWQEMDWKYVGSESDSMQLV